MGAIRYFKVIVSVLRFNFVFCPFYALFKPRIVPMMPSYFI